MAGVRGMHFLISSHGAAELGQMGDFSFLFGRAGGGFCPFLGSVERERREEGGEGRERGWGLYMRSHFVWFFLLFFLFLLLFSNEKRGGGEVGGGG